MLHLQPWKKAIVTAIGFTVTMKPIMRKTWVEVTYWDCGNQEHHHKNQEIAAKCMAKSANKKTQAQIDAARSRYITAMRSVVSGATWKESGLLIGVSEIRCRDIVRRFMRMILNPSRLSVEFPQHDYFNVREVRQHKEFWLSRADLMAKEWGLDNER
jgi:hypothetical protein